MSIGQNPSCGGPFRVRAALKCIETQREGISSLVSQQLRRLAILEACLGLAPGTGSWAGAIIEAKLPDWGAGCDEKP